MKPTERDTRIYANLIKMCEMARKQGECTTPCETALRNIVSAKEPSYREVLLCIIVQMMLDLNLKASEKWKSFNARGIYDSGPVKRFLKEQNVPHTKSGPLNISKAAKGINMVWATPRRSSEIATQVVEIVLYLEAHNSFEEVQAIGISLIKKLLCEAERIQDLSVDIPPSKDPDKLTEACIQLIKNAPDLGNTPQQIAAKLLKCYHRSIHSSIDVIGGEDRASVTSTTSHKPGDINEECCGRSLKVYEITVKPFDEGRIIDSYDCIKKFRQHCEQQIHEVIVICRPEDCPEYIQKSGFKSCFGSVEYQDVKYYFWDLYEWIASMLQRMPDEGKELFSIDLNGYINDVNTSEVVKVEWRKIHGIE